ncbi:hypothetical protein [Nocardia harenae]|uniref:hypothetical protein n=1 Tax=Nocardia harenae TaxID=358707 RepID=UPI0008374B56|nr:hypothetical protein [Nocardia harenae]
MAESGGGCTALRAEIASFYSGFGEANSLMSAFRSAALLIPITADDQLVTSRFGGIDWVCAFTSEHEYARYVLSRGYDDATTYRYHTLLGGRVADWFDSRAAHPTGVVVDIAGTAPMAFPPEIQEGAE